ETELQQPAGRQELPAVSRDAGKAVEAPLEKSPAAPPPTPALPRPTERPPMPPKTEIPAAPAAPGAADQVAPQPVPEAPGKASPRPAFAPAPPTMKEERIAPAAEAPYGNIQSFQPIPGGHAAKKAKKSAAPMNMDLGAGGYNRAASEAARGTSGAPGGMAV